MAEKTKKITKKVKTKKKEKVKEKEEKPKVKKEKKKVIKEIIEEKKEKVVEETPALSDGKYWEAVGRRKTAVARVRLFTRGDKLFIVNEKPLDIYLPILELQQVATASLRKMKCLDRFRIQALVKGGGLPAQAEAIRHGAARALVKFNNDFRKRLRKGGYLTRDPRMRERKKFGLKRARRAPQWAKR